MCGYVPVYVHIEKKRTTKTNITKPTTRLLAMMIFFLLKSPLHLANGDRQGQVISFIFSLSLDHMRVRKQEYCFGHVV